MIVRDARPGELAGIGELRVAAYRAGELLSANPGYAEVLRGLGIAGTGEVLVAEENGRIVGTVMLEPFHRFSEIARSPGEAEVRALAVAPQEQHRGTGRALIAAVIERATVRGVHRLLLTTQPAMTAAQHLSRLAGFTRLQELGWSPAPACRCSHSVSCFRKRVPQPIANAGAKGHPLHPHEVKSLQPHLHRPRDAAVARLPEEKPRISRCLKSLCISSSAAARPRWHRRGCRRAQLRAALKRRPDSAPPHRQGQPLQPRHPHPGSADEAGTWYAKRWLELGKRGWARRIGVHLGAIVLAGHGPAPVRTSYSPQELRGDPTARRT